MRARPILRDGNQNANDYRQSSEQVGKAGVRWFETGVEIHVPRGRVWEVLTDFDRFPEWNPFIRRAYGRLEPGARISISFRLHGGYPMRASPTIIKVEPPKELAWIGHLLVPGLIDGEHHFILESLEGARTVFIQRELYRGVLVPLLWWRLKLDARSGFEAMNRALKAVAEGKNRG